MKAMKKILALTMTLAMVAVLVMAMPAAYADGGVSMTASGEGSTVTVVVTSDVDLSIVGGIRFVFTVPEGFTMQSETHIDGLDSLTNKDNCDVYLDTSDEEGIEIAAGSTLVTVVFVSEKELEPGDYDFSVSITEAFDAVDFQPLSIKGATATATYTVVAPAVPTADPDSGEVEKGTEVKFSSETEGAEIYYSTDGGETWTKGDSLTVNEKVTVQVKAVKDGVESEIAEFSYTVKDETPPVESTPVESTPVESTPVESTPVESAPAPTATQKPVDPKNPTTGDESNLTLYVVIMFATLALGAVTFVVIRKGSKA